MGTGRRPPDPNAACEIDECVVDRVVNYRRTMVGEKKMWIRRNGEHGVTLTGVASKRPGGGRVERDESVLSKLGLAYSKESLLQIHIIPMYADGLAHTQSGNG